MAVQIMDGKLDKQKDEYITPSEKCYALLYITTLKNEDGTSHNFYLSHVIARTTVKLLLKSVPTWDTKKGAFTRNAPWGVIEMAQICQFQRKKKRLVFSQKQAFGGDKRDRTADLLNAIQALSQLSYTPIFCRFSRLLVYYTTSLSPCQLFFAAVRWNFTFCKKTLTVLAFFVKLGSIKYRSFAAG